MCIRTGGGLRRCLRAAIALWIEVGRRIDAGERDPDVVRDAIKVELLLRLPADVRRVTEAARRSREAAKYEPLEPRGQPRKRSSPNAARGLTKGASPSAPASAAKSQTPGS